MREKTLDGALGLMPSTPGTLLREMKKLDIPGLPEIVLRPKNPTELNKMAAFMDDIFGRWIAFFEQHRWELNPCYNERFNEDWSWLGVEETSTLEAALEDRVREAYNSVGNNVILEKIFDRMNLDPLIFRILSQRLAVIGCKNVTISSDS